MVIVKFNFNQDYGSQRKYDCMAFIADKSVYHQSISCKTCLYAQLKFFCYSKLKTKTVLLQLFYSELCL